MSESTRYELSRRLADALDYEEGINDARIWLEDDSTGIYWPVVSPCVNQVEDIVSYRTDELQARGALGFGADLKPTVGYIEIPGWLVLDFERRKEIAARIERSAEAIGVAEAISTNAPKREILIADEDDDVRGAVRAVLKSAGYAVCEAVNGQEAIDETRAERPHLVIMAWLLPGIDGKEAARELKSDPQTANIPIVMLTKKTRIEDKVEALNTGVQDFITKPFDFRELIARIEQQVRWRSLLGSGGSATAQIARDESVSPQLTAVVALLDTHDFEGALKGATATAKSDAGSGAFESAAQAYVLASKAAEGARRPDLANEYQREAGNMYLRLAESSSDNEKIQHGYTMAARLFLIAGNLAQAQQAATRAES
jgi:CheY-like chemotaxis protein